MNNNCFTVLYYTAVHMRESSEDEDEDDFDFSTFEAQFSTSSKEEQPDQDVGEKITLKCISLHHLFLNFDCFYFIVIIC